MTIHVDWRTTTVFIFSRRDELNEALLSLNNLSSIGIDVQQKLKR